MHADRLQLLLADGSLGELARRREGDLSAVGGEDAVADRALEGDAAQIGEILQPQQSQALRRDLPDVVRYCVHEFCFFRAVPPVTATSPLPAVPFRIGIVRTGCSITGRTTSIDNRPFASSAPDTSRPSARTKLRWNWRAAMPRCRKMRSACSFCLPRMLNWFA